MSTLGSVGSSPAGVLGPIRASRWARFQELMGELEPTPPGSYLAGHAACHALMNGVSRVTFAGLPDGDGPDRIADAVRRLARAEPPDLLVAPGVVAADAARALVDASAELPDCEVWLDGPRGSSADAAIAHASAVGADGRRVRLVVPWVPTLTPGRRRLEPLPGTCLVGPLRLGVCASLRGVHECPAPPNQDDLRGLAEAGCGLLTATGVRRLVGLAFPRPRPIQAERPPTLDERLRAELADRLEPLCAGQPNDHMLWKRLERSATSLLEDWRRSGRITGYTIRCDEETSEERPVVEVWLETPARPGRLVVRLSQL